MAPAGGSMYSGAQGEQRWWVPAAVWCSGKQEVREGTVDWQLAEGPCISAKALRLNIFEEIFHYRKYREQIYPFSRSLWGW